LSKPARLAAHEGQGGSTEEASATTGELQAALEQLRLVEEQLRTQGEELAATRDLVEHERERYQDLFEHAPDAYLVTDTFGKILEANPRAATLLGVEQRFLAGKLLVSFVHPERRSEFRRTLARLGLAAHEGEMAMTLRARRGETFQAGVRVTPAPSGDGTHERFRWTLRDLTARKLVEEGGESVAAELRRRVAERTDALEQMISRAGEERDRLRQTFERLEDGIVTFDRELRVEFVNSAAKRLLHPARVVVHEPLPDAWPGLSLPGLGSHLFGPHPAIGETRVEADGRTLSVRGIRPRGTGTAVLVIVDVSGHDRRERAERDFVMNAAHELRTPLAAITSAIEVLQAGAKEVPEDLDRFLGHIERETARLGRLARSLLLLARVQTGKETPRLELLELEPLLRDVAATLHPGPGIEVRVECLPSLAVLANRDLVEQALSNLAANSAKYTNAGEIRVGARELPVGSVEIEVADTGPGMLPHEQERAFDRFYQGRLGGASDGFGLGLAIASRAVRATGGELKLESSPDRGTRAWFVLPSAKLVHT
jgi:PAS domain S-box-containing protein